MRSNGELDAEPLRRWKEVGREPDLAVGPAAAEQALEAEDLARSQVEDRLELDEEASRLKDVDEPQSRDLPAGPRERSEVADGVPLGLSRILGRDADVIGEGSERLFHPGEEFRGRALDGDAPGPAVDLAARPDLAERQRKARSASGPSGRTKRARAFRQRSSRPRAEPSRTLSGRQH